MRTRSFHSSADPKTGAANFVEKILSSDAPVILLAIVLVLVLIGVSGCAPVPAAVGTTPAPTPTEPAENGLPTVPSGKPLDQPTPGESAIVESAPIVAVVKKALGVKLGISIDEITFVSGEYVEWTTSCLGMEGPREMCLQVITPGYRIFLMAQGVRYEVHTDMSGRAVRIK